MPMKGKEEEAKLIKESLSMQYGSERKKSQPTQWVEQLENCLLEESCLGKNGQILIHPPYLVIPRAAQEEYGLDQKVEMNSEHAAAGSCQLTTPCTQMQVLF